MTTSGGSILILGPLIEHADSISMVVNITHVGLNMAGSMIECKVVQSISAVPPVSNVNQ